MGYNKLIKSHYEDLNNMSSMLRTYIEMYRYLTSSIADLHSNSAIKKGEIKDTLERIEVVGDIIDDLLKTIKKCEVSYIKYCSLKNEVIAANTEKSTILTELNDDLDFHN